METKQISVDVILDGQRVDYVELCSVTLRSGYGLALEATTHKLKVAIRSDSYDNQCYARVKRWNGNEWKLVHALGNMKTKKGLAYGSTSATTSAFKDDRNDLIRVALEVLS